MNQSSWVRFTGELQRTFWLDGFPVDDGATDSKSSSNSLGSDGYLRELWPPSGLEDGGIAAVQWLNIVADKAVLLHGDGTWISGGRLRIFISPGAYKRPYEFQCEEFNFYYSSDPEGWKPQLDLAIDWIESNLIFIKQAGSW